MAGGAKEKNVSIDICAGDSCKEHKSKKLRMRLEALVEEWGLTEEVMIAKCGCLGRCKQGIAAELRPGNKILKELKPKHAERLLEQVITLLKGRSRH